MEIEFRPMRRRRQQLSDVETRQILQRGTSGVLSLLGDHGYPYGVPISYVLNGNAIFFHSALDGHKIDAIRNHNKASFTVIDQDNVKPKEFTTYFRSAIAFGKIHIIEDEKEKLETARALSEQYNPGDEAGFQQEIEKSFSRMVMIRFDIEHLSGKEAIELVRAKTAVNGAKE